MSDAGDNTATESGKPAIPEADVKFIIACLQNTIAGNIVVDNQAVATALGFANPRSVSNKITKVKKDYNIPFGSGKPSAAGGEAKTTTEKKTPKKRTAAAADVDPDAATPTPRKRKSPVKKQPAKPNSEPKVEEDDDLDGLEDVKSEESTDGKKEAEAEEDA